MRVLTLDSGIGGLSVVDAMARAELAVSVVHLADDAWRPYGDKPAAALAARVADLAAEAASAFEAQAVVLACNTASTVALEAVPTRLPHLPVIGVVPPVKPAAARTRTGAIAILATPATIARPYVDALVHQFAPSLRVVRHGSLALVEMAEGRLRGRTPDPAAVAAEIAPLFAGPAPLPDQVCLACTHFPLLADLMAAAGPPGVSWIDSGEAIARRVAQVLGVGARPGGFHFAAMLTTGPGKALDALQPPFAWWRSPALDSLPGWGR